MTSVSIQDQLSRNVSVWWSQIIMHQYPFSHVMKQVWMFWLQMTESAKTLPCLRVSTGPWPKWENTSFFIVGSAPELIRQGAIDFHMGATCENTTNNIFCSKQVHIRVFSTQIHGFYKRQEQSGHEPSQRRNRACLPILSMTTIVS